MDFSSDWSIVRRFMFCLAVTAGIAGAAIFLIGGNILAVVLLLGLGSLNGVFFYRRICVPLKVMENNFLYFERGYDSRGIFNQKECFTTLQKKTFSKIEAQLKDQQAIRLSNRQAQYLALQNQINPHFLYNTLEAIRGDALEAGITDVAAITESLATFFRYTISNTDSLVTLEEELNNAENYFSIQNYRFGDRISMTVTLESGCEDAIHCMIPKLTLQPIIENAIIHGLEHQVGPGVVTVHIRTDGHRLLLDVTDNGIGMSEEVLKEICDRLNTSEQLKYEDEHSRGGIALTNVDNRIGLLFGKPFGLKIFSVKGIGTRVEIVLPVRTASGGE